MPEVETASERQVGWIETSFQGGVWVSQGMHGPSHVECLECLCPGRWPQLATSMTSATCGFLTLFFPQIHLPSLPVVPQSLQTQACLCHAPGRGGNCLQGLLLVENLKTVVKLTKSWFAVYGHGALEILNDVSETVQPSGTGCFPTPLPAAESACLGPPMLPWLPLTSGW